MIDQALNLKIPLLSHSLLVSANTQIFQTFWETLCQDITSCPCFQSSTPTHSLRKVKQNRNVQAQLLQRYRILERVTLSPTSRSSRERLQLWNKRAYTKTTTSYYELHGLRFRNMSDKLSRSLFICRHFGRRAYKLDREPECIRTATW
jgi:exonuclease VII large subunit